MTMYAQIQSKYRRDIHLFGSVGLWLLFRCLPAVVVGALVLMLLSMQTARANGIEVSARSEVAPGAVESGQLLMRDPISGRYRPAILIDSRVHFAISGLIATVKLEQTFRNDSGDYLEGVYAFPLPETGAVRYMEMRVGERRIIGKVREKAEAKRIYDAAKKAGKKASLVEQQRPNLFTNRIANLPPGESITVVLEYVQAVEYLANSFSLRFPMTITPRYMPGQPLADREDVVATPLVVNPYLGWAAPTTEVPDAHAISPLLNPHTGSDQSPLHPIRITATLDMGMPLAGIESPYHEIALTRRAGVYSIELAQGVSDMNRDFVLTWQPVTGSAPQAAFFTEQVGQQYYGLLMVVPPSAAKHSSEIRRELIFVVDTSGSMGGVSIEQARASLTGALDRLQPEDRFNIIEFDSTHRSLFRNSVPATRNHVARAKEFVRLLHASGGTEMMPALQAALARRGDPDLLRDSSALRQVIFITDGAVGNEQALFEVVARDLGNSRLFTVGIGSAPNSHFMRKAAQMGRGSHTHIGKLDEVGQKMAELFDQLSRPAAVNIALQWPATVEAWPARVPDLYHGEPLAVAVSFGATPPSGEVLVQGQVNGVAWQRRLQIGSGLLGEEQPSHDGVATLWARRKIAGLLDTRYSGSDETAVRAAVLPVALQHQLLSPYTSFIAVEEVVTRPEGAALKKQPVPNARPHGQSQQSFAYPATATTGPAKLWFGAMAMFLSLLLHLLRRAEGDGEN